MRLVKTNKKSLVVALACALLLGVTAVVFSQQGPHDGRRGPWGMHGGPGGPPVHFMRDLNLSEAQKAQIKQITSGFSDSTKTLREQLRKLHDDQFAAMKEGAFDEAAVRAAAQARANVEVELEVAHARMMSQVYNVLTADQKAQLAQKRQEFEEKRRQWESQHQDAPDSQQ